jgi:hypothetical protein
MKYTFVQRIIGISNHQYIDVILRSFKLEAGIPGEKRNDIRFKEKELKSDHDSAQVQDLTISVSIIIFA